MRGSRAGGGVPGCHPQLAGLMGKIPPLQSGGEDAGPTYSQGLMKNMWPFHHSSCMMRPLLWSPLLRDRRGLQARAWREDGVLDSTGKYCPSLVRPGGHSSPVQWRSHRPAWRSLAVPETQLLLSTLSVGASPMAEMCSLPILKPLI